MGNIIYNLGDASKILNEQNISHSYLKDTMLYVPKNVGIKCENGTYTVYGEDDGKVSTLYSGFSEDRAVKELFKRCKVKYAKKKNRG